MRLPSKGIDFGSIMLAKRGSAMTFLTTRSRCARDSYTIQENTTVSADLSFTLCGNEVVFPTFTSSATHSVYSRAPCSRQIFPAFRAMRRYACRFFFGTGTTNPSTYLAMRFLLRVCIVVDD